MKRSPMAGTVPPLGQVKVTPSPPIDFETETPVLLVRGNAIKLTEAPLDGAVVLESLTNTKHASYMLLITEKHAHDAFSSIASFIRARFTK